MRKPHTTSSRRSSIVAAMDRSDWMTDCSGPSSTGRARSSSSIVRRTSSNSANSSDSLVGKYRKKVRTATSAAPAICSTVVSA